MLYYRGRPSLLPIQILIKGNSPTESVFSKPREINDFINSVAYFATKQFSCCCWILGHTNIHTYIIGHYNPSVRIIDLVSHTTCVH